METNEAPQSGWSKWLSRMQLQNEGLKFESLSHESWLNWLCRQYHQLVQSSQEAQQQEAEVRQKEAQLKKAMNMLHYGYNALQKEFRPYEAQQRRRRPTEDCFTKEPRESREQRDLIGENLWHCIYTVVALATLMFLVIE